MLPVLLFHVKSTSAHLEHPDNVSFIISFFASTWWRKRPYSEVYARFGRMCPNVTGYANLHSACYAFRGKFDPVRGQFEWFLHNANNVKWCWMNYKWQWLEARDNHRISSGFLLNICCWARCQEHPCSTYLAGVIEERLAVCNLVFYLYVDSESILVRWVPVPDHVRWIVRRCSTTCSFKKHWLPTVSFFLLSGDNLLTSLLTHCQCR